MNGDKEAFDCGLIIYYYYRVLCCIENEEQRCLVLAQARGSRISGQ